MRILSGAAVPVLMLLAAGCGGGPPKPTPTHATLVVGKDANPDSSGRPSPVVLRVYQLKQEGAFNDADYFALTDKEQETLGPSLVAREEYELQPGDTRAFELKIAPEAHFLGASVGFFDIRNAKWKTIMPTPANKLTINVGKSEVAIAGGK